MKVPRSSGKRSNVMGDIKDARILYLKGALFLLVGVLSSAILLVEAPTAKVALLLGLAVWSFARAYYFVFYVIEHYIDDQYKFSGLWSFVRYLLRSQNANHREGDKPIER